MAKFKADNPYLPYAFGLGQDMAKLGTMFMLRRGPMKGFGFKRH